MPGTKWWMWRAPDAHVEEQRHAPAHAECVSRTTLDEITKADSRLNSTVSPVAASLVAPSGDLDACRARRGPPSGSPRAPFRRPRRRPGGARGARPRRQRRRPRCPAPPAQRQACAARGGRSAAVKPSSAAGASPPQRHISSRSSGGTSRTWRAGTPITTARAGTSSVTTAPAATNASSPISTPGHQHRAGSDAAGAPQHGAAQLLAGCVTPHRVVVGGDDARADEDVVLDHRTGRQIAVGLDAHEGPDRDFVLDATASPDHAVGSDRRRAHAPGRGRRRSRSRRCARRRR